VAAFLARDHPAQRALVLPFGFASSLRWETRLQDWTHRYSLSYRDLEEIMAERGVEVDHSTINRWVLNYAPELDKRLRRYLKPTNDSWRVDETYIKIKGKWKYLYRAVDS
jgi:transposase-like protein